MNDYILEPLEVDDQIIFQDFVEFVQKYFPDWEASEGQLDVIIARFFAMHAGYLADMATRVQRAIFRYLGNDLVGIPPLPGSPAQALIHFNVDDPLEPPIARTLPFGTLVGITAPDGDTQVFSTTDDLDVTAGSAYGEVGAECIELGSIANDITGTVELVEMVDWITSGYVVGSTYGGSDPESDDDYIYRLTSNFAMMAPRPILADDFAIMAQNVPGVWRAMVLDNFLPGTQEVQRITSNYTGGTFPITFNGKTTAQIPATATAAQVRDAMAALPNFDLTDGDFTGGPLPTTPITVTFKGKYVYMDVPAMTVSNTALTGGSSITVTEVTKGTVYALTAENAIGISAIDQDGNPLSSTVKQQLIDYLNSTRAQNFIINFIDPAYYTVDINYQASLLPGQDPDAATTAISNGFTNYLSPARWGLAPQANEDHTWLYTPMIRYLELTTILEMTSGVDYTMSLTFSVNGSAFDTTDKSMSSPFALTLPGNFSGTTVQPTVVTGAGGPTVVP